MTGILQKDIISMFHKDGKPTIYGKSGEKVEVISEHGDVLIVKGKKGDLFPVNIVQLKISEV